MPLNGDHPMHPFAIDAQGNLLVSMGSATNACEVQNRMPHSPGNDPCTELETRAGIWRYDANKPDQVFSPKERYATGIRNGEGFDFDTAGRLYVTEHGRDQLHEDWPELYTAQQGVELPAERVLMLKEGGDYGWPTCYFDPTQKKLVLAPEYGGDGGKKTDDCAKFEPPVAAFPAHWAPNDLKIYKASQFPKGYQGGAFIAFHGSWNRAPSPQGGYNVVFQPLSDGKTSGDYIVFADGFAGKYKDPGRAAHRPSGDGGWTGRRALHHRRQGWPDLARDLYRRPECDRDRGRTRSRCRSQRLRLNALPPEGIHPMPVCPYPQEQRASRLRLARKIFPWRGCRGNMRRVSRRGRHRHAGWRRSYAWAPGSGAMEAFRASPTPSKPEC